MKLYATVTSERATKGQGGNHHIIVNLKDENENVMAVVTVHPRVDNVPVIFFQAHHKLAYVTTSPSEHDAILSIEAIKGKKQKDVKVKNPCGHEGCSPEICGDDIPF